MTHFCLPSKNAQGFKIEDAQNNKPKNFRTFCILLLALQEGCINIAAQWGEKSGYSTYFTEEETEAQMDCDSWRVLADTFFFRS